MIYDRFISAKPSAMYGFQLSTVQLRALDLRNHSFQFALLYSFTTLKWFSNGNMHLKEELDPFLSFSALLHTWLVGCFPDNK